MKNALDATSRAFLVLFNITGIRYLFNLEIKEQNCYVLKISRDI